MTDKAPELTTQIVAAFLVKQPVAVADLPQLIGAVHRALSGITDGASGAEPDAAPLTPAVPIRRSVTADHVICLEDGKRFKSIKRHLQTAHGMDPAAYRAKWGLKTDYPMVASNYAEQRSTLAKAIGLGQGRRKPAEAEAEAEAEAAPPTEIETPAVVSETAAVQPESVKPAAKRVRRPKGAAPTDV